MTHRNAIREQTGYDSYSSTHRLWSQPGSKASANRAFFDTHFGPFWRSEMIIARPFADGLMSQNV